MEKVIKIALCDDQRTMYACLKGMLQKYMESRREKYELLYYMSGEAFLEYAEKFQLVFLDVEMPEMNGFLVAEELRRRKLEIEIIFLTSHEEMARQAFHVNALRYLPKPCVWEEWEEAMEAAFLKISKEQVVRIETRTKAAYIVSMQQIQYMEAFGDESCIYLPESHIISKRNLKYWETELTGVFIRCHRSYLVNIGMIEECGEKQVRLKSGKKIPLAYRKKKQVLDEVCRYQKINF